MLNNDVLRSLRYALDISDAQMAALIKHFRLHIDQRPGKHVTAQDPHFLHLIERPDGQLNAAVVYCVAAMQRAKGAK